VTQVIAENETDILTIAAAVEKASEHPLGKAIYNAGCKVNNNLPEVTNF